MLTQREESPLLEAQRRVELAMQHRAGKWTQHTTDWAILPIPPPSPSYFKLQDMSMTCTTPANTTHKGRTAKSLTTANPLPASELSSSAALVAMALVLAESMSAIFLSWQSFRLFWLRLMSTRRPVLKGKLSVNSGVMTRVTWLWCDVWREVNMRIWEHKLTCKWRHKSTFLMLKQHKMFLESVPINTCTHYIFSVIINNLFSKWS